MVVWSNDWYLNRNWHFMFWKTNIYKTEQNRTQNTEQNQIEKERTEQNRKEQNQIKLNKTEQHCKLTRRGRSNAIDITVKTLWLCCSSSSNFTHKSKKISQIQNIFVLFNSSSIKGVIIKTFEISILRAFYFSLTWQSRTNQNNTEQNRTEQNRTEQHRTEQNKTEQNRTKQNKSQQNRTEQNRTKQNTIEQTRTKHNKIEQNRVVKFRNKRCLNKPWTMNTWIGMIKY